MDKIVGKLFGIFFLLITPLSYGRVSLQIFDLKGNRMSSIAAGKPFKIEVRWDQPDRQMRAPQITGIEPFKIIGRETSMHFVNGVTTLSFNYRVSAEKPGLYTVGPASIPSLNGDQSVAVKLLVKKSEPNQEIVEENKQTVFARLVVDKKNAVINEKIHCILRFYFNNPHVSLLKILPPELVNVEIKNQQEPTTGSESINGSQYMYVALEWDMYCKQAGVLTIPAYGLDCSIPAQHDEELVMPFFRFFNRRTENKRLYSNSIDISIDPLPEYKGTVHGIGNFKYFSAQIHPQHAKVGEGFVLRLDLEGEGETDVDSINLFELERIPDSLKWYDSASSLQKSNQKEGFFKKSFEYIVQALKPGELKIPEQQFTFFDPKTRKYKTLSTESILIQIEPALTNSKTDPAKASSSVDTQSLNFNETDDQDHDQLASLDHQGPWFSYQERHLVWWLFLLLLLMPLLFTHSSRIYAYVYNKVIGRDMLYVHARVALTKAEKTQKFEAIYPIFITFFQAKFAAKNLATGELEIEQTLLSAGLAPEQIKKWQIFLSKISEFVFFNKEQHAVDASLFKEAFVWLDIFEKNLS